MEKFQTGDLVRNPFGVVFEITDIDTHHDQIRLKNQTEFWHDFDEIEDWDLFRKI